MGVRESAHRLLHHPALPLGSSGINWRPSRHSRSQTSFHAEQLDAEEHAASVEGIAGGSGGPQTFSPFPGSWVEEATVYRPMIDDDPSPRSSRVTRQALTVALGAVSSKAPAPSPHVLKRPADKPDRGGRGRRRARKLRRLLASDDVIASTLDGFPEARGKRPHCIFPPLSGCVRTSEGPLSTAPPECQARGSSREPS